MLIDLLYALNVIFRETGYMEKPGAVDMQEIEDSLRAWLSNARRVVVVGVGSSLRKDDFVGVEIVRNL